MSLLEKPLTRIINVGTNGTLGLNRLMTSNIMYCGTKHNLLKTLYTLKTP